jgi:hypothetical protein
MTLSTESMKQHGELRGSEATREGARRFLRGLREHLNRSIPCPPQGSQEIEAVVKQAKVSEQDRAKRGFEGAFLNHFVAGPLHEYLMRGLGLNAEDACSAFLSESYKSLPGIASGTPARSQKHPFTKVTRVSPRDVIARWNTRNPLTQSCPDMALRVPSPYTIFLRGSISGGVGCGPPRQRWWRESTSRSSTVDFRHCLPHLNTQPGTTYSPASWHTTPVPTPALSPHGVTCQQSSRRDAGKGRTST